MEISCEIIRDVLPLYAEDMASPATRDMVDEHLCGCDGCTKELAELLKKSQIPVDGDISILQRLSGAIRRRKALTVIAVLLTISAILMTLSYFATLPVYLPCEKAIEGVELREDGVLAIDYSRAVTGRSIKHDANGNQFLFCETSVYAYLRAMLLDKKLERMTQEEIQDYIAQTYQIENIFQSAEITQEDWDFFFHIEKTYCFQNEAGEQFVYSGSRLPEDIGERKQQIQEDKSYILHAPDYKIIYVFANGRGGALLLDEGEHDPDWTVVQNSWNHDLYEEVFYASMFLSVLLFFWIRWKKPRQRELAYRVMFLFASIAFAIMAVSHCQFHYAGEWMTADWLNPAIMVTANIFLAAIAWRKLYILNRQG